jgi:hypothetical protein
MIQMQEAGDMEGKHKDHSQNQDSGFNSGLFQAIMAEWIYQDGLMWNRTQLLIAIQGAAIALSYSLRFYPAGPAAIFIGMILTLLLNRLVRLDKYDRDKAKDALRRLVTQPTSNTTTFLAARYLAEELPKDDERFGSGPRFVAWFRYHFWSGDGILAMVTIFFITLDITLAILFITQPGFVTNGGIFPPTS